MYCHVLNLMRHVLCLSTIVDLFSHKMFKSSLSMFAIFKPFIQFVCLVSYDCNVVSLVIFEDVFFKVPKWSFIRCFLNKVSPNFWEVV